MLQIAQNKIRRAVLSVANRYSADLLHSQLEISFLFDSRIYYSVCLFYKGINDLVTQFDQDMFHRGNRSLGLHSQMALSFTITHCNTVLGSRSLLQYCNGYWASIPAEVKNSQSLDVFKKYPKSFIFA